MNFDIRAYLEPSAVAQIVILYAVIYAILKRARGSRFGQALLGVGILVALAAVFTFVLHFDVLAKLVQLLLLYLALSTVVIFQPEIRRGLAAVGAFGYFDRPKHDASGAADPDYVVQTILALGSVRLGALIAFERGISLRGYEADGVTLESRFSRELVQTIFTPPLPLHDGGMTIRNGRIAAAHCIFPVSNNPELAARGTRHRAAVGLSEETDALVVVVSEESGAISVAHNGRLFRYRGAETEAALRRWVGKAMSARRVRTRPLSDLADRFLRRRAAAPAAKAKGAAQ